MSIRFICPKGHRLAVPDDRAGKRGRCSLCNQRVVVPLADNLPADVPVPEGQTGWAQVRFEGESVQKPAAAVPIPVDDDTATRDLSEPLSPADLAAQSSAPAAVPLKKPTSPQPAAVRKAPVPRPKVRVPSGGGNVDRAVRYRLDRHAVRRVYVLAIVEAIVTLIIALPALKQLGSHGVPAWAWIVFALVAMQTLYMLWVVTLPDWSTVWMGSLVFSLTSGVHLSGLALCLAIARETRPLGLASTTLGGVGWCAAVAILALVMAYVCVRISRPWREEYEAHKAEQRG